MYRPPPKMISRCGSNPGERSPGTIVAIPGDQIEIKDGRVYVNGDIATPERSAGTEGDHAKVPPRSYYVIGLGTDECDSRHWGYLPEDHVVDTE